MLKRLSSTLSQIGPWSPERRLRGARLVTCDLDGTLLNGDGMIGVTTAVMVKKIVSIGIPFVIITARHHQAVEPYAEELRLEMPIISLDGAITMDTYGTEPSSVIRIDQDFALDIIDEIAQTPHASYCAVTPGCFYLSQPDLHLPSKHEHWNIETAPISNPDGLRGDILELIITGDFHGINTLYRFVEQKMRKGELSLKMYESVSRADSWYLEVRSDKATKLHALVDLGASLGIPLKEMVGIGDHRNDIDFCAQVGYAVAVNNAVKELKKLANFITEGDCIHEGINEFLEYFLTIRGVDVQSLLAPYQQAQSRRKRSR